MIILLPFLLFRSVNAIAFFPFIVLKNKDQKENKVLINHEKIHIKQQIELLVFFFFLWYLIEYIIRLIIYQNFDKAYRNICFEKEAYANEDKLNYLKKRNFWSFVSYL